MRDDDLSLDWVRERPDLCLIHQDGIVSAVSDSLAEFLGYQAGDLVGRCALDLVHGDDRPYIAERIEAIYATQIATKPALQRLLHKDGHPLFVEVHSMRIMHRGRPAALTMIRYGLVSSARIV